jgi:hypothetical protein
MEETKILHINLNKELHRQLKMQCVAKDMNMKKLVEELIRKYLEQENE